MLSNPDIFLAAPVILLLGMGLRGVLKDLSAVRKREENTDSLFFFSASGGRFFESEDFQEGRLSFLQSETESCRFALHRMGSCH